MKEQTTELTYSDRIRKEAEARGVIFTKANLGPGPAHDYGKGPGSWTGD